MENKQITLREIYEELQNLKEILKSRGLIDDQTLHDNKNIIWDWPEQDQVFSDDNLLGEDWFSKEDEEAWKDL